MLLLLGLACRPVTLPQDTAPVEDEDLSDAVYDLGKLLRVEVELDPQDWDALRSQTRTFESTIGREDCQEQPFENPFTWYTASVTLDGQEFPKVEVRKKGFLGSMSFDKPALKVDLGEFSEERFYGVRRLTLNNSVSDPSFVRQCLSYAAFADAGLPAPRCSLAHVTVNGQELGIYVNLEPLKGPMLERHFEHGDGNLYEGTLSDFREGWTGTLEKKNNEAEDDWSDIDALVAAVDVEDEELVDSLRRVIDLEQFVDFWALEVLVQHTDGYASNTNNFYLYADPSDGRFDFIPWGTDGVLYGEDGSGSVVYANGVLANRLYNTDEGREFYLDSLQGLLKSSWKPKRAEQRVATMAALVEPELSGEQWAEVSEQQEWVLDILRERRERIEDVLDSGAPEWPWEPRESFCFVEYGAVDATFSTTWGSLQTGDPWTTGSSTMLLDFDDGELWPELSGSAVAGKNEGESVIYLPAWISDTEAIILWASVDEAAIQPGDIPLDFGGSIGALFYIDTTVMQDFEFVAYVVGELQLDQAATTPGAPIEGRMVGAFMSF